MMPINAQIPLGVNPLQIQQQDPNAGLNSLARMMQISGAMDEQKMNALKMDEAKRGIAEENQLRSLYGSPDFSWSDPAKRAAAFAASPTKAQGHYKAFMDADKERFTMAKEGYGIFQKAIGAHAANPNASKQGVLSTIQGLVQMGVMNPTVAGNIAQAIPDDPQQLRGFLRDALTSQMSGEQVLTAFAPKPTQVDNGQQIGFRDTNPNSPTYGQVTAGAPVQRVATPGELLTDQRTRSEGAANRGVTIRGQDKADARAREANAQGKVPAGYRQKADGSLEFIPGGPADPSTVKDKALTEGQAKANLFGTRMQESNKVLAEMEKSGVKRPGVIKSVAESVGNIAGLGTESMGGALSDAAGTMTNWTQSAEQQQVEQAQRDFLNAVLRRESGASIAPHEFRNANKQYFPQPNDDDATLALKARNRQIAIDGMLAEVPEHKRTKVAAPNAPTKITNDAEFNALPKGAEFIGPDGKHRRKP